MAKKKKEQIVLNKTGLMPTTIGTLDQKENGPIVAIVLIVLFVVCIFLLPYVNEWLQEPDQITKSPPSTTTPSDDEPNVDEPTDDVTYYTISNDLTIDLEGFQFSSFAVNSTNQTLNFTLTNVSGEEDFFETSNYFMELYSSDNKLLQRIKLEKENIVTSSTYSYDVSTAFSNGTINKLTLSNIATSDYPNVSLSNDTTGTPYLTCTKDNQTLTYYFTEQEGTYELNQLRERITFQNTAQDYNTTLENYTTLVASLNNVAGVTTDLVPTTSGFTFELILQLGSVTNATMNRYFTDNIYYAANTEAKVVAFELESEDYTCQ